MSTVVLTGPRDALTQSLRERLAASGVGVVSADGAGVDAVELKGRLGDADAVVHVAGDTATVMGAAADAGVRHVVLLSSATVYGAWPDNPVPLTEAASLRPNPGAEFAALWSESERVVREWREADAAVTATVLRTAPVAVPGQRDRLFPLLAGVAGWRVRGASRPVQAVHVDDVAAAVDLAVTSRLDGAYNVAPDGWISDDTARAVAVAPFAPALPARAVSALAGLPPPVLAYAVHPWVVANDRLRAAGWTPEHSNEEALIATQAAAWRDLSPKRRQQVALAGAVAALAGGGAGVVALFRRRRS